MDSIAIVDYGCGNLFNLEKALGALKVKKRGIVRKGSEIASYDKVILPGVGAFQTGMTRLLERGMDKSLREYAAEQKPILGICLGMQLLMSSSEEFGFCHGLDLIGGSVVSLGTISGVSRCTLPNVGWAPVRLHDAGEGKETAHALSQALIASLSEQYFYFTHSFAVSPHSLDHSLCVTDFHEGKFPSVVCEGRVVGTQFHPELSGKAGLGFLRAFLEW